MNTIQRKRKCIRGRLSIVFCLIMILSGSQVYAGCPGVDVDDTDGDGFRDTEECTGLSTTAGAKIDYPSCRDSQNEYPRDKCLDPDSKDIFVELVPWTGTGGTLIPSADLFEYFALPESILGVVVHELSPLIISFDRNVIMRADGTFQKALSIGESPAPVVGTSTYLGYADWGTPNNTDGAATIYTQRIVNWVTQICPQGTLKCWDKNTGFTYPEGGLIEHYMRYILAHELSHMMKLTLAYNDRFGGHHSKTGTGAVMDQSVVYTARKGEVTFYIPRQYSVVSRDTVNLTQ